MRTSRRPGFEILALVLTSALAPVSASADPPGGAGPPAAPDAANADADAAFHRGLERYAAGDFVGAIEIWDRLLATIGDERGWRALYNLGLAYEQLGDPTHAIERYDAFVRQAAAHGGNDAVEQRRRDAEDRLRSLRSAYGAVTVRAPATGEVVMVRVGTGDPRPAGFTVYLAPGPHDIEVGAGTVRARHVTVKAVAGGSAEIDASLAAPPAVAPPPSLFPSLRVPESPQPVPFPTTWLLVGAGATLASFALPLALGLHAQAERDQATRLGAGNTGYVSASSDYMSARTAYYVSYALPASLAAATAVIVILEMGSSERRVRVNASGVAGGGCLWASGRF